MRPHQTEEEETENKFESNAQAANPRKLMPFVNHLFHLKKKKV
jgi:hypothetical protein